MWRTADEKTVTLRHRRNQAHSFGLAKGRGQSERFFIDRKNPYWLIPWGWRG
jgi:hypothetical protein